MNTTSLPKFKVSYVIIILVVLFALYAWSSYNSLVKANLAIDGAWAQVESQYQRRFDLIPNLVASVEGVMRQEKEIFLALAEARSNYAGAGSVDAKAAAAGQVEGALGRLLAIVENYPQLKSSENMSVLMAELAGTENRVATERMRFNEAVGNYNRLIITFPRNLMANMFGFDGRAFFEAKEGTENTPTVNFGN